MFRSGLLFEHGIGKHLEIMPVSVRAVPPARMLWSISSRRGSCNRAFSVLKRPPPNYPGHVPLTFWEQGLLAIGSAVGSLWNPRRGGLAITAPHLAQSTTPTDRSPRSHCGTWRSYRNPLLHISAPGRHALQPYRQAYTQGPTSYHISDDVPYLSPDTT
jgi:hypothetical protein